MRIDWHPASVKDLDDIAAHISADNPRAAAETLRRIRRTIGQLTSFSQLGRNGTVSGTRELVVPGTPYVIPYRFRGESIQILRVFHGKRKRPLHW